VVKGIKRRSRSGRAKWRVVREDGDDGEEVVDVEEEDEEAGVWEGAWGVIGSPRHT
jgi:hypothetical protein